jgi:tRNA dimethylallyltransferase
MDASCNEIPAIAGPTACGKTGLVLKLAAQFSIEVLSCDSRKVFIGADIGAAKPTRDEQKQVRFHLMDLAQPCDAYSVQQYAMAAHAAITEIRQRGMLPLIEGGTGLYLEALMRGYDFHRTPPLPKLRELIQASWALNSAKMIAVVQGLFPRESKRVDMLNLPRVIRLLERMLVTGVCEEDALRALEVMGFSVAESEVVHARRQCTSGCGIAPVPVHGFCLHTERAELVRRIEMRTEQMIADGLVEEVAALILTGIAQDAQVLTGIGYREAAMYLRKEITLEQLAPLITLRTRQFAKRQDTWNRNRFCSFEQLPFTTEQERNAAYERIADWIAKRLD